MRRSGVRIPSAPPNPLVRGTARILKTGAGSDNSRRSAQSRSTGRRLRLVRAGRGRARQGWCTWSVWRPQHARERDWVPFSPCHRSPRSSACVQTLDELRSQGGGAGARCRQMVPGQRRGRPRRAACAGTGPGRRPRRWWRSVRSWDAGTGARMRFAQVAVSGEELVEPGTGHAVGRDDLGDGSLLHGDGGDGQARLRHGRARWRSVSVLRHPVLDVVRHVSGMS